MTLEDGLDLSEWEGGLFDLADTTSATLLVRLQWAFREIRLRGGRVTLTEAARPRGVPLDQYARNAWDTKSGRSTMWYQWGRKLRGETPSAINPSTGTSNHTRGKAADISSPSDRDVRIRNEVLALVGIEQTIPKLESWHYEIVDFGRGLGYFASTGASNLPTPATPESEDEDMAKNAGFSYEATDAATGSKGTVYLIVMGAYPAYHEYGNGFGQPPLSGGYNNPIAAAFETGSFVPISAGHAAAIKAGIDRTVAGGSAQLAAAILELDDDI